jgi:hypothetical protein
MSGIIQDFVISSAGAATKCADVVFSPPSGTSPLSVGISTSTTGAHIFYASSIDGSANPTHTGDSAGPGTVRIGSNSGSISVGGGTHVYNAIAYEPSHLDSDISQGSYEPSGGA